MVNAWLQSQLPYAMTMEKGSHNILPFNNTTRIVLPHVYLNRVAYSNWEVYVRDSLRNDCNVNEGTVEYFESLLESARAVADVA